MTIIDGRRWAQNRLVFLDGLLSGDLREEQRTAIEHEMEQLRRRAGFLTSAGMRRWLARQPQTE